MNENLPIHTALTIPEVEPMRVRKIFPLNFQTFGGYILMDHYKIEDAEIAEKRLDFDADVIDCSNRMFELTTVMMGLSSPRNITVFPSRRWRNFREGENVIDLPTPEKPLLFIGNPIRILMKRLDGMPGNDITVQSDETYVIKSGPQLGY